MPKRKLISYEDGAEGQFLFDDGQTIKFDSALIRDKSAQLFKQLFESQTDEFIKIHNIKSEDFGIFLDCFLSNEEPEIKDVFRIVSVALKYELKDFVNELIKLLRSKTNVTNIIVTLNVSLLCANTDLTDITINLLKKKFIIYRIFNEEKYYLLLEPKTVAVLVKNIKIDTEVLNAIMSWGRYYLEKTMLNDIISGGRSDLENSHNSTDLKTFIKEHNILETLDPSCFQSYENLINFAGSDFGKDFFSSLQLINYFRSFKEIDELPEKSMWVKVRAGEKLHENFVFDDDDLYTDEHTSVSLKIKRNPIVFFNKPKNKKFLVKLDVEILDEYEQSESASIKNKHGYLPSGVILDFPIETDYSYINGPIKVNCTWKFYADCRIVKTFCNYSDIGSKDGYYFCGKIEAKVDHENPHYF